MKRKSWLTIALSIILLFTLGQSAMAFSDVSGNPHADKINALKEKGILGGYAGDKFKPGDSLTYASGISIIVKGLDLNLNHVRFVKQPKATDHHPNLKDDAWYSQAFVIADFYGLDIPTNVKANDKLTKEQFAQHLFKAISAKGDYAFIKIYVPFQDEKEVNGAYMDSIQKLLISKIAALDSKNYFYPKKAITRGEAAAWLHDAIEFVETTKPIEPQPEFPYEQKLTVEAVNKDINKVTISATVPHPGYGLRIVSVQFDGTQAIIHTEPVLPDPDKMYPQVITEIKVSTYVDSAFKPVLAKSSDTSVSSEGFPINN
ncbi:S-layer homology domain-containing protein [Paenibacillus sp. GCM10027627]|uniref:S-layer homology domain-containing protein n=1 Tax=unclassified Paenibacillus TaxID=185978 RepID=UPI00362AFD85